MSQTKPKENGGGSSGSSSGKLSLDIKSIKGLVELMIDNDLSRIELREGESHIVLRRGHPNRLVAATGSYVPPVVAANPAPAAPVTPTVPAPTENEIIIRSPMVGTFYAAPDQESPPFVDVGTVIEPNTVVCLIEAMKVFNELKAEVSGRITKVLVKNAAAIEFDQPLFAVAPA